MKVVAGIAIVLVCEVAFGAQAAPINNKLCILNAAQKLPAIPGLTIQKAAVTPEAIPTASAAIVDSYDDMRAGYAEIKRALGLSDYKVSEDLRRRPEWETDGAALLIKAMLAKGILDAASVELTVRAATVDVTYSFSCVWTKDGHLARSTGVLPSS